jgi:AcrR family transcriptional regulator
MTPRRPTPRRPSGGSQERAERTRALVVRETVRCVVEEGYAAASARHIAERAGVTWGVIQYHFGDREALMMAVVDEGYAYLMDALGAPLDVSPRLSIRTTAERVVTTAWEAFSTPTSMAALEILIATRADREPAATQHLANLASALSQLGLHIGRGLRTSHAAAVGNLLWAALRGMVLAQMVVATPIDTSKERRALVDVIVTYTEQHQRL